MAFENSRLVAFRSGEGMRRAKQIWVRNLTNAGALIHTRATRPAAGRQRDLAREQRGQVSLISQLSLDQPAVMRNVCNEFWLKSADQSRSNGRQDQMGDRVKWETVLHSADEPEDVVTQAAKHKV